MKTTKKLFIALTMLVFCVKASAQQDSIVLHGTLKGLESHKVYISFKDEQGKFKNFASTANGDIFSIKIPRVSFPLAARFNTSLERGLSAKVNGQTIGNPSPALDLFIFNKDINIKGDAMLLQFASLSGDKENNLLEEFKKSIRSDETKSYLMMQDVFNAKYNQLKITRSEKEISAEQASIFKQSCAKQKQFINQHPEAFASVFLLTRRKNIYTVQDYINAWNKISPQYKKGELAENIEKYIKKANATPAGTLAIDFEKHDKDGNIVKLSDFKNKVVLLDFWGSWCAPCRASHPHLKILYDKYKADGFEIIGIAQERQKTLDESKSAWSKAIADDGINWIHVLNQEGIEQQDLVKQYGVIAFPTKILIDRQGKVLLRITASATDDIDKALAKIYGH